MGASVTSPMSTTGKMRRMCSIIVGHNESMLGLVNRSARSAGWLVLLATIGAAGCGGSSAPTEPSGAPSERARAYLDELIGLMQAHSINRQTIDWSAFRTRVFAAAAGAQSISDTYGAIQV